jgi:hypothetical protein
MKNLILLTWTLILLGFPSHPVAGQSSPPSDYVTQFFSALPNVQGLRPLVGGSESDVLAAFRNEIDWVGQERIAVEGQPFTTAERIRLPTKPGNPWAVQYNARNQQPVSEGQIVGWVYYARSPEAGTLQVKIDGQGLNATDDLDRNWKRFTHFFRAKQDFAPEELKFNYFLGTAAHTVELGGLVVFVTDAAVGPSDFPEDLRPTARQVPPPNSPRAQKQPLLTPGEWIPDENQVQVTLHVDDDAQAGGDGSAARPMASARTAMERAIELMRQGQGVRILLAPGIYREALGTLNGSQENDAFGEAVLVIEAEEPGTVFFRGSKILDRWLPVDGMNGVWKHAWDEGLKLVDGIYGRYNPPNVIAHRRELLFADGIPLSPVMLENYAHVPRERDAKGAGSHRYIGELPLTNLVDGSFGVRDGEGPSGERAIFVRLPQGLTPDDLRLEAAYIPQFLDIRRKRNVVLRNLVFEHSAGIMEQPAVSIGVSPPYFDFHSNSYLIENCRFDFNNGAGFRADTVSDLTMRNCTFNDNGFKGLKLIYVRNSVFDGVEINRNNWRGGRDFGGGYWWAEAGMKSWVGYNNVYRNWRMIANQGRGFWLDGNHEHHVIDGLTVTDQQKVGIDFEISRGPITMTNAFSTRNGEGVIVNNSQNVTITNSRFVDNRGAQFQIGGLIKGRSIHGLGKKTDIIFFKDLTFKDNVMAVTHDPESPMFSVQRQASLGVAELALTPDNGNLVTGNIFSHIAGRYAPVFYLDPRYGGFEQFQERYDLSGNAFADAGIEVHRPAYQAIPAGGPITLIPGQAHTQVDVTPLEGETADRFAVRVDTPAGPGRAQPHLVFRTDFDGRGAYYLWAHVRGDSPRLHARLDGRENSFARDITGGAGADAQGWRWIHLTDAGRPASVVLEGPATREVRVWLDSPELEVDRIVLEPDADARPSVDRKPVAIIDLSTTVGYAPLRLSAAADRSLGNLVRRQWLVDDHPAGEGMTFATTFETPGVRRVKLALTDTQGRTVISERSVEVRDPTLVRMEFQSGESTIEDVDRLFNGVIDDRHHSWFGKRPGEIAILDLGAIQSLRKLAVSVTKVEGREPSPVKLGWSETKVDGGMPANVVELTLPNDGELHSVPLPENAHGRFVYVQNLDKFIRVGEVEAWGERPTP